MAKLQLASLFYPAATDRLEVVSLSFFSPKVSVNDLTKMTDGDFS